MGAARAVRAAGRLRSSGSGGAGGEMRSSLRIYRATKGLDCDITLRSRRRKAHMKAGGEFKMYILLHLLETHGPELEFEAAGPDSQHARDCIAAILREETTELTPADRELLNRQGRFRGKVLADLPPPASARWLAWLHEDKSRVLPWNDEPLPMHHKSPYPYTQATGGLTLGEYMRGLNSLPAQERRRVETMGWRKIEEYLCAPDEVRREMLAASAA